MKKAILLFFCLLGIVAWCWSSDKRDWYYYPKGLYEWWEEWGYLFFDSKDCEKWALDKYYEWYDAYCSKNCKDDVWWTPICEDVIRTRHPMPWFWKVFDWIDEGIEKQKNEVVPFEKKEKCVSYYEQYKNYLEDLYEHEEDGKFWYENHLNELEIFYNSRLDTCIAAYSFYGATYDSGEKYIENHFAIVDYLNWQKDIFNCRYIWYMEYLNWNYSPIWYLDCLEKWEAKKDDLKS